MFFRHFENFQQKKKKIKKIDFRSKKVSENWAKVFVTVVYVVKYMLVFAPEDPCSKSIGVRDFSLLYLDIRGALIPREVNISIYLNG